MTRYFIGIGSNDNALENCQQMISALQGAFDHVRVSRIVQTEAWGVDAPDYMNAVACIETDLDSEALNRWCKAEEQRLGRIRQQKLCTADLDILMEVRDGELVNLEQVQETYFRPLIVELI